MATSEVYLVISDLHMCGQEKSNRIDYDGEIRFIFKELLRLLGKYSDYSIGLVFLGDIFDRSYRKPSKVGVDLSLLGLLLDRVRISYSLVGNHEISYPSNNPFWTLLNSVDSDRLNSITNKNLTPLGYVNRLQIIDTVAVGDTVFHMNHYGVPDSQPVDGKKNIAFYHKAIYNSDVVEYVRSRGVPLQMGPMSSVGTLSKYTHSFMGHMHLLSGTWQMPGGSLVTYLPSLGRPSRSEVMDAFLDRNIPALIFESGSLVKVEDNIVRLPSWAESILPDVVQSQEATAEVKKAIADSLDYLGISDDPVDNIRSALIEDASMHHLLDMTLIGDFNAVTGGFSQRLVDLRSRRESADE